MDKRSQVVPGRSAQAYLRAANIAVRTAHILVAAGLFGGVVFEVSMHRLTIWFCLTVATGIGLAALEIYPSLDWWHEGRGLCVLVKLALLGCAAWFWEYRVGILMTVIVIASVGSHMPRHLRHYSVWRGDTSAPP